MENLGYQKASFRQGMKTAKDFDLPIQYGINARRRFLTNELELYDLEIAFYHDYEGEPDSEYFSLRQMSFACEARNKVNLELMSMKKATTRKPGITDDMIEQARNYPVENLIEFTRGTARAWCHEDNHPSLFHATRINKAICPVCDKKFSAIDVLIDRDGMDFKTAVKSLINF